MQSELPLEERKQLNGGVPSRMLVTGTVWTAL